MQPRSTADRNRRPLITINNPKSPISESYRMLRTNINFSAVDGDLKVIMITSAGPDEGKSTTAANLAVVYAQSDKKVLIIDADLRKPTMHHTFQESNRWGLSSLLVGQTTLSEVITSTSVENLDLLTAGYNAPNPSELLASKRMRIILDELKSMYDMIIIDTPPALVVTDSRVLASMCDGVLIVIDSGRIKRETSLKVKAGLEHVNARILGVIVNNVERKNHDYYYYYYNHD